ncbi:MAG: hypothetical protein Q7K54_05205 [Candidatus Parcubacteria bacterium]|nr:hypothetical protein [Candidatus Parcubacteria bacterium]
MNLSTFLLLIFATVTLVLLGAGFIELIKIAALLTIVIAFIHGIVNFRINFGKNELIKSISNKVAICLSLAILLFFFGSWPSMLPVKLFLLVFFGEFALYGIWIYVKNKFFNKTMDKTIPPTS